MTSSGNRSVREVVQKNSYDGLLLDQYGVLHNGVSVFPRAEAALKHLKQDGSRIVILSNSSRRSAEAYEKLDRMGLDQSFFVDVVTSGELAHSFLSSVSRQNEGRSVCHLNWGKERGSISLKDYDLHIADNAFMFEGFPFPSPKSLSMVVCHGVDAISNPDGSIAEVPFATLERFVKLIASENPNVPFVCANPDLVTVAGSELRTMPGTLALAFQEAGGTDVRLLGKPFDCAYDKAIDVLKSQGCKKFLAIGDSLAHDILGAHSSRHQIDSLYIAGGIDAESFGLSSNDALLDDDPQWNFSDETLRKLINKEAPKLGSYRPTFVMPFMR